MFALMLAVLLSAGEPSGAAPKDLVPPAGPLCRQGPIQKISYWRWLHTYPYTRAISQQSGYNYRLQRDYDYPWSVRSSYSLSTWAAASTRVPWAAPEGTPGEPAKQLTPTGPGATSSR
jgi:hypothetical protein